MGKYLDVGKKGVHFNQVANRITREYIKKGYPPEKAREIGRKTAGKVFWHKFKKKKGRKIIKRAKAKAGKNRKGKKRRKR